MLTRLHHSRLNIMARTHHNMSCIHVCTKMFTPCLSCSPRMFTIGSNIIYYDKGPLTLMDTRLNNHEIQFDKPLIESWVQFYLTIYPSHFFSNVGLKSSLAFVPLFVFNMRAYKPNSSHNVNNESCHAPLPKIRGNGVATRVDDIYTRGKYPTYTR